MALLNTIFYKSVIKQIIVILFLLAGYTNLYGQLQPSQEYRIKAIFLFNFTQFAKWPSKPPSPVKVEPSADSTKPFVIGVIGKDPYGIYLDETVKGEKVNNRPIVIQRYNNVKEINNCQILFISKTETSSGFKKILTDLKGNNTLTVSDIRGFSKNGGMIEFVRKEDKIALRINNEAVTMANLQISSKLLGLAEIVKSAKN